MSASEAELVSIIMPAYNAAQHIAESIASVQAQSYPHWELLIIDDGSTDATSSIAQAYHNQDQRIRYLYQDNARQGRARNNGLAHALGAYVAFLDSDDLWLPEKLATQLALLKEQQVDLVFSDTYVFENATDLTPASETMHTLHGLLGGAAGLDLFLVSNRIPILTVLCRRHILVAVGGFTENRLIQNAEDYHLWLKLLLDGYQFWGASQVLAAYRVHAASVSSADRLSLRQAIEAKADLLTVYPQQEALLRASMRRNILHSLEVVATMTDGDFYTTLYRYLHLTHKTALRSLFWGLQRTGTRALALRLGYFVFNYL